MGESPVWPIEYVKTCPPVVFPYSYTIFLGSHTIFLNFYTILAITEFDSTISVDVTLARYREWMGWSVTHCGGGGEAELTGSTFWTEGKESDVDVSARLLIKLRRGWLISTSKCHSFSSVPLCSALVTADTVWTDEANLFVRLFIVGAAA